MNPPPCTLPARSSAARVQQLLSLAVLGCWVMALWPGHSAGWWWAALAHPGVLAVQFALAAWGSRGHAGRPGPWGWTTAWAREWVESVRVFGWRQPWRWRAEPDHCPPQPQPARGVLLVHGYFCNRGMWSGWVRRLRAAGHPVIAVNLEPLWADISAHGPLLDEAVARLQHASGGLPPLVVAHSMGGLVVRSWLAQQPNVWGCIHQVVTLGTPHHGTWLAWGGRGCNARQMRWHSPWLQSLATAEATVPTERATRFVCWHSLADNIVMPAGTGLWLGAEDRLLFDVGHMALAEHPAVWADVMARL
jgi:pimeloyl-ACP methyl ester carboxylesterase